MEITEELDPRRWWALGAALTAVFLTLLDGSVVVVALPSIGSSLGAQTSQLQWMVSGYILAFGLVPIVGGRLGDDRGRKKMLLLGVAGFVAASALGGVAWTPAVLLIARVIQGTFGGLLNPQVAGVIQNLFPPRERPRAFGLLGILIGVASATGPVFGGLFILLAGTHYGWRVMFLVNIPIGGIALIMCTRYVPSIARNPNPRRLDLPGVGLLAIALFAVLFPAIEYDSNRDPRLAYLFIPALALLGVFYWWEAGPARRRGSPLINIELFRIRTFADGCILGLVFFAALAALPLILTFFLQDGLGYSAVAAGAVASSSAVGVTASSYVAGRLMARYGTKVLVAALWIFTAGIPILAGAIWWGAGSMSTVAIGLLLLVPLAITGFGSGGVVTPNQALSYLDVDTAEASTAGGILQTAQRVSIAIGSALVTAVFYAIAQHGHPAPGRARWVQYGHGYLAALVFVEVLAVISLAIAIRAARNVRPVRRMSDA
jgi:EmrB/QacA subfamily drug resistance transporter